MAVFWSTTSPDAVLATFSPQSVSILTRSIQHDSTNIGVRPERRPFPAADVLRAVAHEALIVAVAASRLGNGGELTEEDRERLLLASSRLTAAVQESGHA